jgi:hypothetical protein
MISLKCLSTEQIVAGVLTERLNAPKHKTASCLSLTPLIERGCGQCNTGTGNCHGSAVAT